jgi:hypothetical protein
MPPRTVALRTGAQSLAADERGGRSALWPGHGNHEEGRARPRKGPPWRPRSGAWGLWARAVQRNCPGQEKTQRRARWHTLHTNPAPAATSRACSTVITSIQAHSGNMRRVRFSTPRQ